MVFSSYTFLFLFLPLVLLAYYALPKAKNTVLVIASLIFYIWSGSIACLLMVLSCGLDLFLSRCFESKHRKLAFWAGIVSNVLILWYFKYSNFFVEQFNVLSGSLGLGVIGWAKVALPAGVSFYTFEKISYLVDVYRGHVPPAKTFKSYLLFVSFFPHLIAGPILRYADISKQIASRSHNWGLFFDGVCRLCVGLARKVLIADEMGQVTDNILQLPDAQTSFGVAWLGMICYSFQIYFDFSAYSDMAIGLARMFGFTFQENFNHPYLARSISDFWQRWHISFSKWMRDYLYIPMGGNRCGAARTYFNLIVCFLLSGFWHGASWNFVLWGGFHGLFLLMDRLFLLRITERLPIWVTIATTFGLVTVSRVMFRLEHFDESLSMYSIMFGLAPAPTWLPPLESVINTRSWVVFGTACMLSFVTPFFYSFERTPAWLRGVLALILFVFSIITLTSVEFSPFLYYQF